MKKFLWVATVLILSAPMCFGQVEVVKVKNPQEVRNEVVKTSVPKEIEGLQWNRWTTKNFVICSLNDNQAQYLHKHLELVKGWVLARWGLPESDFSVECKVICVDDPAIFKKLFGLDSSRSEVRRDQNGRIKETVLFLLLNDSPSQTVPVPLTEICLAEFSQKYNTKIGWWAYRGMAILNGSLTQIRERVGELKPLLERNEPLFFTKGLLETDREQYFKLPEDKRRVFDNCAMAFCLMVRKEFGQDKYLEFLKMASNSNPEAAVRDVLKFADYNQLDRTFKRYMVDLAKDIASGKTPDHYLQIREKHD